ncbi:MAG TPA: hypothetical protein VFG03_17055 [Telluria sp.]|nr:hypothetical protein [Telluria sp.]
MDEIAASYDTERSASPLSADEGIEVHRVAWQEDRMIETRNAELQPAQEIVVGDRAASSWAIFRPHWRVA